MTAPFRIFSGWDARQAEAADVFAFSVREHASIPVELLFITTGNVVAGQIGLSGASQPSPDLEGATAFSQVGFVMANVPTVKRHGVTAFSYCRFLVPYLCRYEGIALFCDGCDQLCLADIAELAATPMDGCSVKVVKHESQGQARPRSWSSLMLLDNAKLTAWTPEFVEAAPDDVLMRFGLLADDQIGELPKGWNWLTNGPGPDVGPGVVEDLRIDDEPIQILHWSHLSDPNGGDWIDRSGSTTWAAARERWRAAR